MHSTEHVTIFTGTLKMLPLNLCNGPKQQNFRPIFKSSWPRYRSRVKYYPILFTEQRPRLLPDPDRTENTLLLGVSLLSEILLQLSTIQLRPRLFDSSRTVCGAGSMKLSSVRLSVRPSRRSAAGLLLWPGGQEIDRLLHGRHSAANARSVTLSADVRS